MSTRIGARPSGVLEPVTEAELRGYFHEAARPRADWRVGAEFEKFGVRRDSGRPLTYEEPGGIGGLLAALADRHGWNPHHNQSGRLTALERDGATVSLEPGGQVELSTAAAVHVDALAAELDAHLRELADVAGPGVAWLAAGASPLARAEDIALMPRVRHAVMAEYLPRRSPFALQMMKATASTQVTFDFADEADAVRKFTVALKLGPVVNALWANAPLYGGAATGCASYRSRIWQHMDPDRSGLLLPLLDAGLSFDAYVDYLLDVPLLFVCPDGRYRPADGRTFRDFMEHGHEGHYPTLDDWELQLTTVFPEVRLKRFLEVRGADATPRPLALAVPAFWKGLLYDEDALAAAAERADRIAVADLPGLFEGCYRRGLEAEYQGRPLCDWCRELVAIAEGGLRRQAARSGLASEEPYLAPLRRLLERGRSRGAAVPWRGAPAVAEVIHWFECGGDGER